MSTQAAKLKKLLKTTIQDMARNKEQFTQSPGKDFTRKRKLDFASVISVLLSMSGGSTASSLMEYFKFDPVTASTSAFVQQRAKLGLVLKTSTCPNGGSFSAIFRLKILLYTKYSCNFSPSSGEKIPRPWAHCPFLKQALKPEAMEYLFQRFTLESPAKKTFLGYRLLAVDGSDLQIFADPNDEESYYPGANGQHPYSLLHLNALYDLENQIYTDALIQKSRVVKEQKALTEMIDRSAIASAILLADRGYEGYNNMAHLQEKGWKFLIRVKDGPGGIASGFDLTDVRPRQILCKRQEMTV